MLDAVLGVDLDDLLVVVGSLQQFDTCVQGTAIGTQQDGDGRDTGWERDSVDGTTLHDLGDFLSDVPGDVLEGLVVRFDGGLDGVLQRLCVPDGDRVGVEAGRGDDGREGTEVTVLEVDSHLVRRRVGSVPQFDVGRKGRTLGLHEDLD